MKFIVNSKKVLVFLLAIAIVIGAGFYYFLHGGDVSTDDAAIDGHIVSISPKVSGYVRALNIQDNQMVKAGDILLEIDPTDYIIRRNRAQAALSAALAAVRASEENLNTIAVSAPSNVASAAAQVAGAQATWEKSSADRQRMETLFKEGACSKQQLDQAIATEKVERSTLNRLQADLHSANTASSVISAAKNTSEQLQAQVKQAEFDLAQAEADLANTKVVAPMDGRITKRSVELGNYVQVGQQLTSIVGMNLWVTANFKEIQLIHMRAGQAVDIKVDAYPNIVLHGNIDSFQAGTGSYFSLFPAENATGNFVKIVQRIPVKIVIDSLPDVDLPLGPGMSVTPTVHTDRLGAGK